MDNTVGAFDNQCYGLRFCILLSVQNKLIYIFIRIYIPIIPSSNILDANYHIISSNNRL